MHIPRFTPHKALWKVDYRHVNHLMYNANSMPPLTLLIRIALYGTSVPSMRREDHVLPSVLFLKHYYDVPFAFASRAAATAS